MHTGQYLVSLSYICTIGAQWGTWSCIFQGASCTLNCANKLLTEDWGTRGSICEYSDLNSWFKHLVIQGSQCERRKGESQSNVILQGGSLMTAGAQIAIIDGKVSRHAPKLPTILLNNILLARRNHQSFSSLDSSPFFPSLPFPIRIFFPTKLVFFFLSALFEILLNFYSGLN